MVTSLWQNEMASGEGFVPRDNPEPHVEEIFDTFWNWECFRPVNANSVAQAHRATISTRLIDIIEQSANRACNDSHREDIAATYAWCLLMEFKVQEALPALENLLPLVRRERSQW